MKKKLLTWVLAAGMMLMFTACGNGTDTEKDPHENDVITSVALVDKTGEAFLDTEVYVGKGKRASDAVLAACKEAKLTFTYKNGMFDNFEDIASTNDEGWILYIDGDLSDKGADDVTVKNGMDIRFRYEVYDEAFGE